MIYEVTIGETTRQIRVERDSDGGYRVQVDDGPERAVDLLRPEPQVLSLLLDNRSYDVGVAQRADGYEIDIYGTAHLAEVVDPRRKALRLGGGRDEGTLSTSMPGKVVRLLVAEGDAVTKGQPVIVIEAMKMENEFKAPRDGAVVRIDVAVGQALESGSTLLTIE